MLWTLSIIILMAGCGDLSAPAAPGSPIVPSDPQKPAEPQVSESLCNEAAITEGRVYFYAELEAPEGDFEAFVCAEAENPVSPPVCTEATELSVEGDTLRVLCGEWEVGGAPADYLPDFVRIEQKGQ